MESKDPNKNEMPYFPHMCETVRYKENFVKRLQKQKQNVRELEDRFKDTLRNVRR